MGPWEDGAFFLNNKPQCECTLSATPHKWTLPSPCISQWMAFKLARWPLATHRDIIYTIWKKNCKVFSIPNSKKVMPCHVYFDSFCRPNSKRCISGCWSGVERAGSVCGCWKQVFLGRLMQIKPNASWWPLSAEWSRKLVVTLLVWWVLTANTDNFSPSGFGSWIT